MPFQPTGTAQLNGKPFDTRIVLTIVENDEIDTDTSIPTISSQKSVTRNLYSSEELEVQLLR